MRNSGPAADAATAGFSVAGADKKAASLSPPGCPGHPRCSTSAVSQPTPLTQVVKVLADQAGEVAALRRAHHWHQPCARQVRIIELRRCVRRAVQQPHLADARSGRWVQDPLSDGSMASGGHRPRRGPPPVGGWWGAESCLARACWCRAAWRSRFLSSSSRLSVVLVVHRGSSWVRLP
jgi:hypothetical protein